MDKNEGNKLDKNISAMSFSQSQIPQKGNVKPTKDVATDKTTTINTAAAAAVAKNPFSAALKLSSTPVMTGKTMTSVLPTTAPSILLSAKKTMKRPLEKEDYYE